MVVSLRPARALPTSTPKTCRLGPRDFETEHLGFPVYQLEQFSPRGGWEEARELALRALDEASAAGAGLVAYRCHESERNKIIGLQKAGFAVVECLLTLEHSFSDIGNDMPGGIDFAAEGDADACAEIGASVFTYDRFHADPVISRQAADDLKGAWARNAVLGRADAVLVTRDEGSVSGFNACMLRNNIAAIDLIGVRAGCQGKGLGRKLVAAALAHYAGKVERMIVGTQSANHASLAIYLSAGFRVWKSELTFHAHLS